MDTTEPQFQKIFELFNVRFEKFDIESINRKQIFIIDKNVANLYNLNKHTDKIIELEVSEENKTFATLNSIYSKLLEMGADRKSEIVAIGGGILCDISAFAAATFLRGINIKLIPTTLLAQCDAAIGGKNGINFNGAKNIIGTIRQAYEIIIDIDALKTLPEKIFSDGFAEIIKIAAIADKKLFEMLENIQFDFNSYDKIDLEKIIKASVYNKLLVVQKDEREAGLRRILNFGHTLAHSLEAVYHISHGQAVAIGMDFATKLSIKKFNANPEILERLQYLLRKFKLQYEFNINAKSLIDFIKLDKKSENDFIHFVILNELGNAETRQIKKEELTEIIYAMYNN